AWAWGLRRTLPCSNPGMCTSAPYRAWPVTLSTPSWRRGLVPTTVNWPGLGLFAPAAIVIRFPSLDQISVVLAKGVSFLQTTKIIVLTAPIVMVMPFLHTCWQGAPLLPETEEPMITIEFIRFHRI